MAEKPPFSTLTGEETKASEELFQNILDAIGDIVFVKGPGSRILWGNKALLSFYGMTQEQLAGRLDAPFVEPDQTEQYLRDDRYVFSSGKRLDIQEEPITRFDGEVRTFHTTKSPVFDSVTAARPNWSPVRREVLSTSGVDDRIFSTPSSTSFVSASADPAGIM